MKEFIEQGHNKDELALASEQQEQLSYFTESKIQESSLTADYLSNFVNRKYQSGDHFSNWIKSIFKDENYILFTKYMRFPLPSSKIVKNKIEPNLKRVLFAENAAFEHQVSNVDQKEIFEFLGGNTFSDDLFYHLMFRHNDILIEDLDIENKAYRYFLDIEKVRSVETDNGKITKIAFSGTAIVEGERKRGVIYIDDKSYKLYDDDLELVSETPHDLGVCPANFISDIKFKNNNIVRESSFTFIREELEEYVFLKTLQKITEPNGAFPVVTKLESAEDDEDDLAGAPAMENQMSGQQAKVFGGNPPSNGGSGFLQPGTVIEVPAIVKEDGSIDTDAVNNYVKFHFIPVEVLSNISERIAGIEKSIVSTIVGDVVSTDEEAKNETQIIMGVSTLENKLTSLSGQLSRIRTISDTNMLNLQYPGKVQHVFVHYGTSFFLESIAELRRNFEDAKNPIERKDIIVQINQNKYKNNQGMKARQRLLYDILPYIADIDFDKAVENRVVSPHNMLLQLQFSHWISIFEAQFGNILEFYINTDGTDEERLALINNLLIDIIKPEIIKPEVNEDGTLTN